MDNFQSLDLPAALMQSLEHMKFNTPTPIQQQAIPVAMEGKDILGSAQTGTGKTGAFGIPLVAKLMNSPRGTALVMTPTRELAVQVLDALNKMLGKNSRIKTALLIGGDSMPKQLQQLRARPRLIVGTPGRINDHLERGSLMLHDTQFLVLDETDRMLDMGFSIQIDRILKFLPEKRQTMLFSATLPNNIVNLSKKYLKNPVQISVGATSRPAQNIKHDVVTLVEADKYPKLLEELESRKGSVIIFVKTKRGADKLSLRLRKDKHESEAIHGDLRQSKRDRVIQNFRKNKFRVMVATDVAARGLDIPHIEHVINFDLPQCAEDYIHRIGRTARAGAEGAAVCFVAPSDRGKWRAIDRLLNPEQYAGEKASNNDDSFKRRRKPNPAGKRPFHFKGKRNNNANPRRGDARKPSSNGSRQAA